MMVATKRDVPAYQSAVGPAATSARPVPRSTRYLNPKYPGLQEAMMTLRPRTRHSDQGRKTDHPRDADDLHAEAFAQRYRKRSNSEGGLTFGHGHDATTVRGQFIGAIPAAGVREC